MAQNLQANGLKKSIKDMIAKETLRLGQEVLLGSSRERAVVDGLTQTFAGLVLADGGYVYSDYSELYECVQG